MFGQLLTKMGRLLPLAALFTFHSSPFRLESPPNPSTSKLSPHPNIKLVRNLHEYL